LLKLVSDNEDLIAVVVCECKRFCVILAAKDTSEEVVLQFWNETLV